MTAKDSITLISLSFARLAVPHGAEAATLCGNAGERPLMEARRLLFMTN